MGIAFEWLDAPPEGDLLEARTMVRLAWSVGDHVITRVYDRVSRSERCGIRVPLYPIARWLVTHWWSLLYEPWPFEGNIPEPGAPVPETVRDWLIRHCIRTATPGFAGPFTCIYSQGREIDIVSRADPEGRYLATPVEFIGSSEVSEDREALRGALAEIVEAVLVRLEGAADERVDALRADWRAICSASAQETEFCRAAGRLGLDPFDVVGWPPQIQSWFERAGDGVLDSDFVTDLLEAPDPPACKPAQYVALDGVVRRFKLTAAPAPVRARSDAATAFQAGYEVAERIRTQLKLDDDQPLVDLNDAFDACDRSIRHEYAPLPEGRVLAVAGWQTDRTSVVVTRKAGAAPTQRFLDARALHLTFIPRGPRLVTDARTWDQRASRAFGAELLAPRAGVAAQFGDAVRRFGRDEAELHVAAHYNVSAMVVRHQLSNQRPGAYVWG